MATKDPLVSIVILNWNGLDDTKICLEHVRKLDYSNYEIVLVDNGSDPRNKNYLSKLKDIIYVDNATNHGFAGGQIDGYKVSKGDFILLLNNDAVIKPDYLKVAVPLFNDPEVAVVGGRAYFWNDSAVLFDETNQYYTYMNVNIFTAETDPLMHDAEKMQLVNTVSGSAVLVRRSAVEQVGYLHEPFFAYYEETDLFARMKRAGYKVLYNPRLCIWHRNGASSGAQNGSSFFYYHIFRNRFIFAMRNFDPWFLRRFIFNYYKFACISILHMWAGPVQRRLGLSYIKAILVNLCRIIPLYLDRKRLARELGPSNYCRQLFYEQLQVSIIIDCTALTLKDLTVISQKLSSDPDPAHEYICVIAKDMSSPPESTDNFRYIIDNNVLDTLPINLGVLAGRMSWALIYNFATAQTDILTCLHAIEQTIGTQKEAILIDNDTLIISKAYYQRMGGLQGKTTGEALGRAVAYASLDKKLLLGEGISPPQLSSSQKRTLMAQITQNRQIAVATQGSRREQFLARHYRLYQATSLAHWFVMPKIPFRLRAGRTKNLLLYGLTLNRKALANELRYIRSEVAIYGKRHARIILTETQNLTLQQRTKTLRKRVKDIPIFIICFERVEHLKELVRWLEKNNMRRIILLDNGSTYPPLLEYYKSTNHQVLQLGRNAGHTAPWSLDIIKVTVPDDYYLVSDPDVIPTRECPPDALARLARIHSMFPAYQKVGLGLKIDDLPDYYPLKNAVIAWEKQFWKTELAPHIYEAGVDTTFALYKPYTYIYSLHPSIRTGDPYTARHMPWYTNPANPSPEEVYYRQRANMNITSWNVDELPDRYKKELK